MERFLKSKYSINAKRVSPLGGHLDELAEQFAAGGYSRQHVQYQLRLAAEFGVWLQRRKLPLGEMDSERFDAFWRYREKLRGPCSAGRNFFKFLCELFHRKGLTVVEAPDDESPVKKLVTDYEAFLREERRLAAIVVTRYTKLVEVWLRDHFGQGPAVLGTLSGAEIVAYIRKRSPNMAPKSAKMMASALRSFLRYAHYRGYIRDDLAICIPSMADWSRTAIPRGISQEHIRRVLAQCDRRVPAGRRDYAILMLLSRLGLRAGEVSSLTLDDFNWEKGCLHVRGKGTENQLPLPPDVGQAIVAYLKQGRPGSNSRQVFLRSRAPFVGFKRQVAILGVVARSLKRAGIDSPRKGCHQFRHALATEMLRRGASLGEIGELLRHRHVQTTTIYAKVDLVALRTLAQPWPGGRS